MYAPGGIDDHSKAFARSSAVRDGRGERDRWGNRVAFVDHGGVGFVDQSSAQRPPRGNPLVILITTDHYRIAL
jgi:hypothetical protein